jgi:hypothetical protein
MTRNKHGNGLGWQGTSQELHKDVLIGSKSKYDYVAKEPLSRHVGHRKHVFPL